jgi:hypothetical protein
MSFCNKTASLNNQQKPLEYYPVLRYVAGLHRRGSRRFFILMYEVRDSAAVFGKRSHFTRSLISGTYTSISAGTV